MPSSIKSGRGSLFYLGLISSGIPIRIIGDIYLGELFFAFYAVNIIFWKEKNFVGKYWGRVPLLLGLWGSANLFSSVANSKSLTLTAISVFTVALTSLSLYAMIGFLGRYPNQFARIAFIFIIGRIIGVIAFPNMNSQKLFWKFGIGEWVILTVILFLHVTKKFKIAIPCLVLCVLVSFLEQARTLGFISIIALLFSLIILKSENSLGLISLFTILILPILYTLYIQTAVSGLLGTNEMNRARILASSDIGPLAARTEILFSSRAFLESPVYGLGFNPEVNSRIIYDGYNWLNTHGVNVGTQLPQSLPLHSFLMSGLVQGGIFAGLFWIATLFYSIRQLLDIGKLEKSSRALLVYVSFSLIDRILFSPFGAYERLNCAFFILILYHLKHSSIQPKDKNSSIQQLN